MRKHAMLLGAVLLGFLSALSYAQAPVPFINQPLIPDATAPGGPQFTLTVNGTGFVSKSVVNWNGSALATQFVSGSQLTATVPAANIGTASTGWVTVVNPAPGGGTSNEAFFTVRVDVPYVAFHKESSPTIGSQPRSVAVGDFNGDGKLDLAVANYGSDTVSILLGDGMGQFTLVSTLGGFYGPSSVAVGDFNRDGKLDLAVTNFFLSAVSVFLGDGTGHFTLASSPTTGYSASSVAVGDFNGDGKLDLAVPYCGDQVCHSGVVSILLGDGTGNFTLASSPTVGEWPRSVAVGDFNGDGRLDLAVANYYDSTVSILLGDGTGKFTLASSPATGANSPSVAVGDFNGDGKLDFAVANEFSGTVSIFLGDGAGNFTLASSTGIGGGNSPEAVSVAVGDFNGDGKLDLAVANEGGASVSILLGDGTGNLTLASSLFLKGKNTPVSVAVGDFNGNGKLDLAAAGYTNTISIVLQVPVTPAVSISPTSLNFGTQLVGTGSNPQPVTLSNTGDGALEINKISTNSVSFSQTNDCPSSLPPSGRCTINVTFNPDKINQVNGDLTIRDNVPTSPQKVPLTGVGTAVDLQPPSLNFGDQQVGTTSQPQPVTLTNYGAAAVNIGGIHVVGTNRVAFAQTNNCGTSVPAGGNCTINVTFTPKSKNGKTATLEVIDNGGASPQTVALSGTGTE